MSVDASTGRLVNLHAPWVVVALDDIKSKLKGHLLCRNVDKAVHVELCHSASQFSLLRWGSRKRSSLGRGVTRIVTRR